jgi:hypothetical protein
MNRRSFLGLLGGTVAGLALEQAVPLGRVWSFPSKIIISEPVTIPCAGAGLFRPGDFLIVMHPDQLRRYEAIAARIVVVRSGRSLELALPHLEQPTALGDRLRRA